MLIIEFVFTFVSLVIMCCAFHERMTRDQSVITNATRRATKNSDNSILTDEQKFHTLIEKINSQICFGLFGFARQTCINAFETLACAKLNRKSVSTDLYTDIRRLDAYVHELELEAEALPLYRKVKDTLKRELNDNHVITQHAKVQARQLHNLNSKAEPTWREVLTGKNVHELVPLLVGEGAFDQGSQIVAWTKEMCSPSNPCYATRVIRKQ